MPRNPDEFGDMPVRQSRISAAGTQPPSTTAPRSVFDQVKPPQAQQASPTQPAEVVVRKGVPLPMPLTRQNGATLPALRSMEVGDSVELPLKQARGFYSHAKKFGSQSTPVRKFVFRRLNDVSGGIWRQT